ncbi:MAG TPA: hypothetical protein VH934_17440 [Xanthobacteraceae bacterium]|jgi:hypothetical protein
MSAILYLLGILVAAAGIAAIGFGIPINEFNLGTTLVATGATGLTGGLILIGLAAVVAELGRVADGLKARPAARPARPAESSEPKPAATAGVAAAPVASAAAGARPVRPGGVSDRPRPEPSIREARAPATQPIGAPSVVDVSAGAIDRLRSSAPRGERPKPEPTIMAENEAVPLSPDGGAPEQPPRPAAEEAGTLGPVTAQDRAAGSAVETLKASRLDFLFRSRTARTASQPENFEALWLAGSRGKRGTETEPQPAAEQAQSQPAQAAPVQERPSEAPAAEDPSATAVLKSGVVDGMAYTLYADGSIEAQLPDGTLKFASIAELRAHIEKNS